MVGLGGFGVVCRLEEDCNKVIIAPFSHFFSLILST